MSLLIKGMEMPTEELGAIPVMIYADGCVEHFFSRKKLGIAIPILPHGDLIDRDALLALCREYAITPSDNEFCKRLEYALTKARPIIPAEDEEET